MGAAAAPRVPLVRARTIAEQLVRILAPACERIVIAGAIRRRKLEVADIDIVALPRVRRDLAGLVLDDDLEPLVTRLRAAGTLRWRRRGDGGYMATGPRRYALVHEDSWIPIDLFSVRPPAQWGAILAIRTGPAEYSQALVVGARKRGLRCEDGRLIRNDDSVPPVERATPEERDFIAACGFPWADPEWRR
ncbi:MAG: hypothetical protein IT379_39585 [Deltaproteobacteria bacterium]|nr:hypothetical protein [Deltaproteobacteria bacterium]